MRHSSSPGAADAATLLLTLIVCALPAAAQPLRDVIGVAHVDGKYSVGRDGADFLSEGAHAIRYGLGSRVIKLWLDGNPATRYPFHSPDWKRVAGAEIANVADHPYYRRVFSMPFTTIILVVDLQNAVWFQDGMTPEEEATEERGFYELTRYLMRTYAGSGKTFVLQNWEGDWLLRLDGSGKFLPEDQDPNAAAVEGMIGWLRARQRGVERARSELADQIRGVRVRNAVEVNRLRRAKDEPSRVSVTNHVLPFVTADLYSYSAWECLADPTGGMLRELLTYLDGRTPGKGNIYVGEYGVPENIFGPAESLSRVVAYTEAAVEWGVVYAVYWQIYCNEFDEGPPPGFPDIPPLNSDMRGFWLVRPDGTRSPGWEYLRSTIAVTTRPRSVTAPVRFPSNR